MLQIHDHLRSIRFTQLMNIYEEGNRENGAEMFPDLSQNEQLIAAEQGFYQYLNEDFFCTHGAIYCTWAPQGRYMAALRLEPYRDGLLLEALETLPAARRCGHATHLILAVQDYLRSKGSGIIYSHVGKQNAASQAVHHNCGFQKILDYAVYVDGSVRHNAVTLFFQY